MHIANVFFFEHVKGICFICFIIQKIPEFKHEFKYECYCKRREGLQKTEKFRRHT